MQLDSIKQLADLLLAQHIRFATAESCTGGMIAAACTDLAGSSEWFECGFVTYSNESKQLLLGVRAQSLERHGAVSAQVVTEMAEAVVAHTSADISVAVSGIAGPGGGSPDKPVGTVYFAWAIRDPATQRIQVDSHHELFEGDRQAVRDRAVQTAIDGVIERLAHRTTT